MAEKDVFYQDSDYLLREIYIRKKGKGNALNEGIRHARNDLICVLTFKNGIRYKSINII